MFKKHFNCALWLGILNLPLACFFGLSYIPQGETPWFVLCTFFFALIGQLFVYFAICSIVFLLPVFNWRKKLSWPTLIYATLILSICHLLLNIDAYLFEGYDQHLLAFLEQFNTNGLDWNNINWMHWGIQVVIIVGYSSVILALARFLAGHHMHFWPFALLVIFMYLLSSGIFMFAHSRNIQPLEELEDINLPKFINIGQIVSNFSSQPEAGTEASAVGTTDAATTEGTASAEGAYPSDGAATDAAAPDGTAPAADADADADAGAETNSIPSADGADSNAGNAGNAGETGGAANSDGTVEQGTISPDNQETAAQTEAQTQAGAATPAQPANSVSTVEPARDPHDFNPFASPETN